MWKVETSQSAKAVVLRLSGRIGREDIDRLQTEIRAHSKTVIVDMKDVRLVDREVIPMLVQWAKEKTTLRNCPAYVREWMRKCRNAK